MDSLGTSAEVIPIGSNSATQASTSYLCKIFYWVSQELFTSIREVFVLDYEVSQKNQNHTSQYWQVWFFRNWDWDFSFCFYNVQISEQFVWWIFSLQEFHCTPLMAGYKTGFMTLLSISTGKLIHWFMAWNWRESKLAVSGIQHLTVKCCCWCKCILNLV